MNESMFKAAIRDLFWGDTRTLYAFVNVASRWVEQGAWVALLQTYDGSYEGIPDYYIEIPGVERMLAPMDANMEQVRWTNRHEVKWPPFVRLREITAVGIFTAYEGGRLMAHREIPRLRVGVLAEEVILPAGYLSTGVV